MRACTAAMLVVPTKWGIANDANNLTPNPFPRGKGNRL